MIAQRFFRMAGFCAVVFLPCLWDMSNAHARVVHSPATQTDLAGNRLEALTMEGESNQKGCTVDRSVCVEISHDADNAPTLHVTGPGAGAHAWFNLRFALKIDNYGDGDSDTLELWPWVLRASGDHLDIVAGVVHNWSTGYSGGGGDASELRLIRFAPDWQALRKFPDGKEGHEVLTVPVAMSLMIRACFSESNVRQRHGACHDEYGFTGTLHLDKTVRSGFPQLRYTTVATSFPGHVSRYGDSLEAPPLRKRDLITVVNPGCTYRRRFQFDDHTGRYEPDKPLPDCGDYTSP